MEIGMTIPMALQDIDWAAVESFFRRCNLKGYVSGTPPRASSRDGYKEYSFTEGPLHFVDRWSSTPWSDVSSGATTIFLDVELPAFKRPLETVPIWTMSYAGSYTKEARRCLKGALRAAYQNPSVGFWGCRGVGGYEDEGLRYANTLIREWNLRYGNPEPSFRHFTGVEEVYDTAKDVMLGSHQYFGRAHY